MATVRPEYGPTLGELLAPRWRALAAWQRRALMALAALPALVIALAIVRGEDDNRTPVIVREPFAFNLVYPPGMDRVPAGRGEFLRLQSEPSRPDRQSFAVRALRLPAYRGDSHAGFLAASARMPEEMRAADPSFVYRGEGRTRVNDLPGYQILFVTRRGGKTVLGRRVLLIPNEPGARDGADLLLLANFSKVVPNVDAVGNNGLLKTPLRSFRFGAERP